MQIRLSAIAATLTIAASAFAQIATTTSLVGTVTDASGRVMVGAKITAVNAATQDTYQASTNQDGYYRIDFVRVGTYNVSVEQPGFGRMEKAGSVVNLNQIVRNDFAMSPGSVTRSVTVEAIAAMISMRGLRSV
jgi:hypothetical protein